MPDEYDELLRELTRLEARAAAAIRKLREERDAARHNSFTESADRDRLAERVWELEQEREALRTGVEIRDRKLAYAIEDFEALRADFKKYADHSYECGEELISQAFARAASKRKDPIECACGLDAAYERWAKKEAT